MSTLHEKFSRYFENFKTIHEKYNQNIINGKFSADFSIHLMDKSFTICEHQGDEYHIYNLDGQVNIKLKGKKYHVVYGFVLWETTNWRGYMSAPDMFRIYSLSDHREIPNFPDYIRTHHYTKYRKRSNRDIISPTDTDLYRSFMKAYSLRTHQRLMTEFHISDLKISYLG